MRKRSEVGKKGEVEEASGALLKAIEEEAGREVERKIVAKQHPVDFPSANAAQEVSLEPQFERVLEYVFVKDIEGTFHRIIEFVGKKGGRTKQDVDQANVLLRKAHDLHMTAKRERYRWELDNRIVFAACYEKAVLDLQREKDAKTRSKQVTDQDVEERFALMYPSEYKHQELKKREVKILEESMANLVAVMEQCCRNMGLTVKP
jgi:hypothetical protein